MSTLHDHFRLMARNNLWSNHRLHRACTQLSPEECARSRGAFFGSILGTLDHIFLVDRFYISRLKGTAREPMLPHYTRLHANLQSLLVAQLESDRDLIDFCDSLDQAGLARSVRWTTAEGMQCSDPVRVVLAHLFLHQIHHRGQVHHMLWTTHVSAPQLDEFLLSSDADLRDAEVEQLGLGL
jgi:uncharacterized damage-inducible protein DinB